MKPLLILLSLTFLFNSWAKDYFYKVEENDQLGVILLSLGHKRLWSKDSQVNLFKKKFHLKLPNKLYKGNILKFNEKDLIFKKNIVFDDSYFQITTKAKNLSQFNELLRNEKFQNEEITESETTPLIEIVNLPDSISTDSKLQTGTPPAVLPDTETIHSFNVYPGIGAFLTIDSEKDGTISSSTFSGLQPMIQLKGIYSNTSVGTICLDLLAKKIITNKFSFPINSDYRFQVVPKWNFTEHFRFAISHSIITHSYVGKSSETEIVYKLNSKFIGFGIVVPSDIFWFEIFFEKAYSGETKSIESTKQATKGYRLDSELVYPIAKNWRILPGLNYYKLEKNSADYSLSVVELRAVLARDFEF